MGWLWMDAGEATWGPWPTHKSQWYKKRSHLGPIRWAGPKGQGKTTQHAAPTQARQQAPAHEQGGISALRASMRILAKAGVSPRALQILQEEEQLAAARLTHAKPLSAKLKEMENLVLRTERDTEKAKVALQRAQARAQKAILESNEAQQAMETAQQVAQETQMKLNELRESLATPQQSTPPGLTSAGPTVANMALALRIVQEASQAVGVGPDKPLSTLVEALRYQATAIAAPLEDEAMDRGTSESGSTHSSKRTKVTPSQAQPSTPSPKGGDGRE